MPYLTAYHAVRTTQNLALRENRILLVCTQAKKRNSDSVTTKAVPAEPLILRRDDGGERCGGVTSIFRL